MLSVRNTAVTCEQTTHGWALLGQEVAMSYQGTTYEAGTCLHTESCFPFFYIVHCLQAYPCTALDIPIISKPQWNNGTQKSYVP